MSEGELSSRLRRIIGEHICMKDRAPTSECVKAIWELAEENVMAVLDEVCRDFPIKRYVMEPAENLCVYEFDRPTPKEFEELIKWFLRWFGDKKVDEK